MSGVKTNNAALAQILNKEYNAAKNTLAAMVVINENMQSDSGQMLSVIPENAEVVVFTPDNTMEQYAKNYKMINNLPTAYVCKGHTCSPPVTSAKELAALLT